MNPCLLFCFAHPDDESFIAAGTAMKAAAAGARIVLVTATRGERGTAGTPPVCDPSELGACRERELRAAAAIIGFEELHVLDYRDRELAEAPPDAMRQALVPLVRRLRPSVVLTFDPNGFNRHPDHVAISRFTSDALAAAADPRFSVGSGAPYEVPRLLWTPPFATWRLTTFDDVAERAGADIVLDVSPWRERKIAALRAHRTQHASVDRHFFGHPHRERVLDLEVWRQAWGPTRTRTAQTDVLAGLAGR